MVRGLSEFGLKLLRLRWAAGSGLRRARTALWRSARWVGVGRTPAFRRFLFAPPDLRTADPTAANDIYAGQFIFAGQLVSTDGRSPFEASPPSQEWAEGLYGFGWLRHMSAANSALARDNAQAIVNLFMFGGHRDYPIANAPLVVARRVLAFLSHSPLLLEGADHDFYIAYLASVRADIRRLEEVRRRTDDPHVALFALLAITAAGLCVEGAERLANSGGAALSQALDEQILPDGGHVSRNPRILIELMLDLLPLRATYAAHNTEAPRAVLTALDRIIPHLKLLRHGDGSLALFNGMGATQAETLATIFACHDVTGGPAQDAPHSGYARVDHGSSLLLADGGSPPPWRASGEAMAGAASFEFSHGRHRIFVNCGVPRRSVAEAMALRSTAAQNAIVVADTSSARFLTRHGVTRLHAGRSQATLQRVFGPHGTTLQLSHTGYLARFGVRVERELTLSADGRELSGVERVTPEREGVAPPPFVARLHLHPSVETQVTPLNVLNLVLPGGETWRFAASDITITIDDSAFFADPHGARRTRQLVLEPKEPRQPMRWSLTRVG